MKDTIYQLVYKSSYNGEVYDDPKAIRISPFSSACEILEIIPLEIPAHKSSDPSAIKFCEEKNRHHCNGGVGSYFADQASAIAALRAMDQNPRID